MSGGVPIEHFGDAFRQALQGVLTDSLKETLPDALKAALPEAIEPFKKEMQDSMKKLTQRIGRVWRMSSRTHNQMTTSDNAPLEIVPFLNGDDPTEEPHNLPALGSAAAVRALSVNDQHAYYTGYYKTRAPRNGNLVAKILLAIGSRA
ncbi:hypothetical protein H0H87_008537 [Tephrocybe sp. NHM501043]|nr:hypothetical protein H0H87_008537 [Tephrocybe sp. NHM501043]